MINKKYIVVFLFSLMGVLFQANKAQGQERRTVTIESVLTDEAGKPIQGAQIYGNEGTVMVTTDPAGKFSITITTGTDILIEADGYNSGTFSSFDEKFSLASAPLFLGERDKVNIAFGKTYKGTIANSVVTFKPDEVLKYNNLQTVYEALSELIPGMYGNTKIRGIGQTVFIIDGLPRDPYYVNLAEVEEISILKDINSSILYGNAAANGAVLITTKRGQAHKQRINVWAHYGFKDPKALPKYLSSADYMEQYNIARTNDGLTPLYDDETIQNYRTGNPYRYPSVDYYSDDYLNSIKPYSRIMLDLSGGNSIATYYSNLSWDYEDNLLNFGTGKKSKINNFNARGNVDLNVTDWIKTSVDAVGFISNDKQPAINYWNSAATTRPDRFSPLLPIDLIDPELDLLISRKNDVDGKFLAGGNSSYQSNPIASVYLGGEDTWVSRNFAFNNRIDVDLNKFVPGLSFHTNISFDYLNVYLQYTRNNYSVYEATWDVNEDKIVNLVKYGEDTRTGTQNVGGAYNQRRIGAYAMFDYNQTFNDVHHVSGNLFGYTSHNKLNSTIQPEKNTNMGIRLAYSYANKYLADFSGSLVTSAKLHPDNRTAFSPSLGLGWVMSSEDFMKPATFVDYLKLKVSGGLLYTDSWIGGYYWYDDLYVNSGALYWYDGSKSRAGTTPSFGENRDLFFEKRTDINAGLEGLFFNKSLSLDFNYFYSIHSDIVGKAQSIYPSYFNVYSPYANYGKNTFQGIDIGASFTKHFGDFSVVLGGNLLYMKSEVSKKDEIYSNDYQYRTGHPVESSFGLVADGFFMSQDEIDNHALQAFGSVQPGDIKYIDQNGDGIIDTNDEVFIGRWQAPYYYGLNLKLSYKRFSLFASGTGISGAKGFLGDGGFNNYYWAQGDNKYSEYMLNHWTEETKHTATYPRLSSQANNNNFRGSSFWMYKTDYFDLNRIQLSYDVPIKPSNKLTMKGLNLFIQANRVLTISKNEDIKNLTIGSEPQYRSYAIGLKTYF